MKKIIVAGGVSLLMSSTAMATDLKISDLKIPNFYVGLEGGTFKADLPSVSKSVFSDSGAVFSGYFGVSIDGNTAVEFGYSSIASKERKYQNTNVKTKYSGDVMSIDVVHKTSSETGIYALGSLGYAYVDGRATARIGTTKLQTVGSKGSLRWGIGVGYRMDNKNSIRMMVRGFDFSKTTDLKTYTIGYMYALN